MRPVRNIFQKLSRTEQRREGVVAYLWSTFSFQAVAPISSTNLEFPTNQFIFTKFSPISSLWTGLLANQFTLNRASRQSGHTLLSFSLVSHSSLLHHSVPSYFLVSYNRLQNTVITSLNFSFVCLTLSLFLGLFTCYVTHTSSTSTPHPPPFSCPVLPLKPPQLSAMK